MSTAAARNRSCELLDWRGPGLPLEGLPDTTPVRDLRNYRREAVHGPIDRPAFLEGSSEKTQREAPTEDNYSRVPRGGTNPTRVVSWKEFDKFLEKSFELA